MHGFKKKIKVEKVKEKQEHFHPIVFVSEQQLTKEFVASYVAAYSDNVVSTRFREKNPAFFGELLDQLDAGSFTLLFYNSLNDLTEKELTSLKLVSMSLRLLGMPIIFITDRDISQTMIEKLKQIGIEIHTSDGLGAMLTLFKLFNGKKKFISAGTDDEDLMHVTTKPSLMLLLSALIADCDASVAKLYSYVAESNEKLVYLAFGLDYLVHIMRLKLFSIPPSITASYASRLGRKIEADKIGWHVTTAAKRIDEVGEIYGHAILVPNDIIPPKWLKKGICFYLFTKAPEKDVKYVIAYGKADGKAVAFVYSKLPADIDVAKSLSENIEGIVKGNEVQAMVIAENKEPKELAEEIASILAKENS